MTESSYIELVCWTGLQAHRDELGELVGRATSGNYGFRLEQSLVLAMIRPDLAREGARLEIKIPGQRYAATVIPESPWDPGNEWLRA